MILWRLCAGVILLGGGGTVRSKKVRGRMLAARANTGLTHNWHTSSCPDQDQCSGHQRHQTFQQSPASRKLSSTAHSTLEFFNRHIDVHCSLNSKKPSHSSHTLITINLGRLDTAQPNIEKLVRKPMTLWTKYPMSVRETLVKRLFMI